MARSNRNSKSDVDTPSGYKHFDMVIYVNLGIMKNEYWIFGILCNGFIEYDLSFWETPKQPSYTFRMMLKQWPQDVISIEEVLKSSLFV